MTTSANYFTRIESNNRYYDRQVPADGPLRDYSRATKLFVARLAAQGLVLGVGSGDGRDLLAFKKAGHPVMGVEPSSVRRGAAIAAGVPTIEGTFENLGTRALPAVAGIWCGAALRHVPERWLGRAMVNVAERLPTGGPLFLMVELGTGAEWRNLPDDNEAEMYIQRYAEETIVRVLGEKEISVVERWQPEPSLGRDGTWLSIVAVKR